MPTFVDAGVDFGIAPHPYFADGEVVTPTGSWHLGITANSENKEEALDFIEFATAGEGSRIWFENINQVPTTLALLEEIVSDKAFAAFPDAVQRLAVYEATNTAVNRPQTPAYNQLQDAFKSAFDDISNGVEAEQALNGAVQRLERVFAQFR